MIESNTTAIDLGTTEGFRMRYPGIGVKTPRWAELTPVEEFRKMEPGDVVLFPVSRYNYNSIRALPAASLVKERMEEGKDWATKLDAANKSVAVIRTA